VVRKGWEKIRTRLPNEFNWEAQAAIKKNKKGRACGGMLLGIRKRIEREKVMGEELREGIMECRIKIGTVRWRMIGVYVNKDMGEKLEKIRDGRKGRRH